VIAAVAGSGGFIAGLQTIYYVDKEAPDAALRKETAGLRERWGHSVSAVQLAQSGGSAGEGRAVPSFQHAHGGQRPAGVCKEDKPDSYDTVADIQIIMSHGNDLLRLYNAPSSNFPL